MSRVCSTLCIEFQPRLRYFRPAQPAVQFGLPIRQVATATEAARAARKERLVRFIQHRRPAQLAPFQVQVQSLVGAGKADPAGQRQRCRWRDQPQRLDPQPLPVPDRFELTRDAGLGRPVRIQRGEVKFLDHQPRAGVRRFAFETDAPKRADMTVQRVDLQRVNFD